MSMRNGRARTVVGQANRMRRNLGAVRKSFLAALLIPSLFLLNGCAGLVTAGSKLQAVFQLSPTTVNFGQVAVGKQATQVVSVSNTGNAAMNVTQVKLSNSQFSVTGLNLPMALAAGQSGNFTVAVKPTAAGTVSGTLTAQGDSGSSPAVVNLAATAVPPQPQLAVSPATIDFGSVATGQKGTSNLVLTNQGGSDLAISLISISGAEFSISGIATPKTITAGQSATAL